MLRPQARTPVRTTAISRIIIAAISLIYCFPSSEFAAAQVASDKPAAAWQVPSNEAIHALLARRMKSNGMGIVVGIVEPAGRRIIVHGRGGAANQQALNGDTIFQIGSVTKVFTTLLLSDMVVSGEVKLEDPVASYLPGAVFVPQNGRPMTLLDLATHMSGLPSMPTNFDLAGKPNPIEAYSPEHLHEFLSTYQPSHQPGEQYAYSNLGVALLGRALAYKAGLSYESLLDTRITNPLNMSSTSIALSPEQLQHLAPGHDRYLQPVASWEMATLPGSGSLRSSVNDLLTFLEACLGYRATPLAAALDHQLNAVRRPIPSGTQLLGWSEHTFENVTVIGHDGGKSGYRSALVFNPQTRTGIVILANARTDDRPIMLAIHLLTGRKLGPAPIAPEQTRIDINPALLAAYTGEYIFGSGKRLRIAQLGNRLIVDVPGDGITEFYPASDTVFNSNTSDEALEFRSGSNGQVIGLRYLFGGRSAEAGRIE